MGEALSSGTVGFRAPQRRLRRPQVERCIHGPTAQRPAELGNGIFLTTSLIPDF